MNALLENVNSVQKATDAQGGNPYLFNVLMNMNFKTKQEKVLALGVY